MPKDRLRDAPIPEPVQHLARLLPAVPATEVAAVAVREPAMVTVRPAVPAVAMAVPAVAVAVPCQCLVALRNADDLGRLCVRSPESIGRGGVGRAGEEHAGSGESSRRDREGHGTS